MHTTAAGAFLGAHAWVVQHSITGGEKTIIEISTVLGKIREFIDFF